MDTQDIENTKQQHQTNNLKNSNRLMGFSVLVSRVSFLQQITPLSACLWKSSIKLTGLLNLGSRLEESQTGTCAAKSKEHKFIDQFVVLERQERTQIFVSRAHFGVRTFRAFFAAC